MILDAIICSPRDLFGDLSPLVPHLGMRLEDELLLFFSYGLLLHIWVEVVMPSFSTLLS